MVYLTRVSSLKNEKWLQDGQNEMLALLAGNPQMHHQRYDESAADFDPFKKRVLEGVTRGLAMASIDHQDLMQENMFNQREGDVSFNENNYPFRPDLFIGYKGNKVLLDVITSSQTMRDNKKPDGQVLFRHKILKHLNAEDNMQTAAIPITSVINYDIGNLQLTVNDQYDFLEDINSQLTNLKTSMAIDFDELSAFGSKFTLDAANYIAALKVGGEKRRAHALFKQLYKVFQIKQHTQNQYELPLQQEGLDCLKFELMKLSLIYEQMPPHQKNYVDSFLNGKSFKDVILDSK